MSVEIYREALAPFAAEAEQLLPAGVEAFDAHTHLGFDEDGRSLDLPTLLGQLDDAGAARACVFPLHDPERKPAYSVPNDRVLGWAGESGGRLIPFCRLDPAETPVAEGERCLEKGARGIKLHPRAQAFTFDSSEMDAIFALAEQAKVPILIHAGRGMPPIADALADLALRHPDAVLILAHGAICDQGILTSRLADHPGVLYDTSCFFPIDVLELFARVPAERVVFASDPPYGLTASGLYLTLRVAARIGLDADTIGNVVGGTMAALVDGEGLPTPTAARAPQTIALQGRLARVYGYGSLAGPALFAGATEQAQGMLDLAIAACRDPDPGDSDEALETIGVALTAARALLATAAGGRGAIDLLFRSMARAATEQSVAAEAVAVERVTGESVAAGPGDGRVSDAQLSRD
ncbi:MAG TPA: amidohydrolase family protein [Solirubrobacteraceae bacterium]|nr:amidohydrolase family protein [Solirubrobacteraceae bacterium]